MLGSVFIHPHRGGAIIVIITVTTDLLTAAIGVELHGEWESCQKLNSGAVGIGGGPR
jgi:hypothetical protein